MDGKGRWVDNVFVERLWKSVKYEEVYLKAYDLLGGSSSRTKGLLWLLQTTGEDTKDLTEEPRMRPIVGPDHRGSRREQAVSHL